MRIGKRLSLVVVAVTTSPVLSQAAGAARADVPVSSVPGVLSDIQGAVAQAGVAPAVDEAVSSSVDTVLPSSAAQPAEAITSAGTLTMDVPAVGRDLNYRDETTAVFEGTGEDTTVAVQATADGVRALVHIDSSSAPERFEFPIGGDVTSLRLTADGGAEALDADGLVIAVAGAPWATDANGTAVPTHYEIDGTTLTQVVEHQAGDYEYGIVADPFWSTAWKITKCAAVLAANAFVATRLIKGLKGTWSFYQFAKLLVQGSFAKEKLYAVAVGVIGIDTIVSACL